MSCDHRQLAVSVVLFPGPHRLPLPCRCKDRSISCDHCRLAVSAPQCFKPPCGWFGDWRPSFRSTSLAGPCCVAARLKCGLATRDYFRFPGALPLLMLCRAPTVFVYATGDRFSYRRCFLDRRVFGTGRLLSGHLPLSLLLPVSISAKTARWRLLPTCYFGMAFVSSVYLPT